MRQVAWPSPMMIEFSVRQANWQHDETSIKLIRQRVFIDEQHVPVELEWDGLDEDALHWLAFDAGGNAIATARLLDNGHIGRMAVLLAYRGMGIGSSLLQAIQQTARQRGMTSLFLNAQTSAVNFYAKAGFIAEGDIFDDAGIPHRKMQKTLA